MDIEHLAILPIGNFFLSQANHQLPVNGNILVAKCGLGEFASFLPGRALRSQEAVPQDHSYHSNVSSLFEIRGIRYQNVLYITGVGKEAKGDVGEPQINNIAIFPRATRKEAYRIRGQRVEIGD